MTTTGEKKYYAFISYKREDEKWAVWLQNKLEHYKLPTNLNGRTDLPKEIRPIFRDQSELAGGVLADEIQKALEASQYLIVICSPRAAQSQWVGKEVQTFIDLGRTDRIIPFIVGGTAHAQNLEDECFPSALLNLPPAQELLGINIDEMGRDAAAVKVVAQMFGLKFDVLWQRYEREQKRKRNWIIAASIVGFLIMAGVAFAMYTQRQQTLKANWKMMENQSRFVAEKVQEPLEEGDSYLAQRLLLEVLPNKDHPDRPCTAEAECAFRNAYLNDYPIIGRHYNTINEVSVSPDGKCVASASNDIIYIWEVATGLRLHTLNGHTYAVNSIAFSPDGKYLASASSDKTVRLWDAATGRLLHSFLHNDIAISVAFSPDSKRIVSASDNIIKVWDIATKKILCFLRGDHSYFGFHSAVFSPDGQSIAATSNDTTINTIYIWDVPTRRRLMTIGINSDAILGPIAYSPSGNYIVTGSDVVHIWDVNTGRCVDSLDRHANSVEFSADGYHILCGSSDNSVYIWDLTDRTIRIREGHTSYVTSARYSKDEHQIVSASDDKTIRVWNMNMIDGPLLQTLRSDHRYSVYSSFFSPNGQRVVSATSKGTIEVWDWESGQQVWTMKGDTTEWGCVGYACFSPDGQQIVSASDDHMVRIWDAETGDLLQTIKGHEGIVNSANYSPDGRFIIVSTMDDDTARIWDIETGKCLLKLEATTRPEGAVHGVQYATFSPDGKRAVTVSHYAIRIWDAFSGQCMMTIDNHLYGLKHVAFSRDGRSIVSTSPWYGEISIWDIETGKCTNTLKGHTQGVSSVAFSPDGRYLVSASDDTTIRIWDFETGIPIQIIDGHYGEVSSVSISPHGRYIVSAYADGTIRIWDFPPLQDLIDQTRERFKDHPLTPEERRTYYLEK